MVQRILILFFVSIFIYSNISVTYKVFWYNKTELNLSYDKFYLNLENKIKDPTKIITNLENLDIKIQKALLKTKSKTQINIFNDLISINKSKITLLKINRIKKNLEENIISNTAFISELINAGYKNIILNDFLEYTDNSWTYKLVFKKYYDISKDNYEYFIKNKLSDAYVIRYKWKFLVTNDYKIEKRYTYTELYALFNNKVDYSDSYILINWEYYTYKYNYYLSFDKPEGLYLSDLVWNKISLEKSLLIKNIDWKYFFSNDYKKIRLGSEKVVENVTNKKEFLYNILDDNRNFENNYDNVLLDMRDVTLELIKNKNTEEEKIQTIYKRVIDNITYYKDYNDGNKQVFSWILTYKNKTWVCDWYTKIFSYMLSIAWISDVEVKRWFAFDSLDFPNFWHAWVRIGNYYYDPTFDDPIWNSKENSEELLYYKIPYDLMYVNRFDGMDIPKEYQWLDLNSRKKISLKNMYSVYDRYKSYSVMSKIKNRIELGLTYEDDITLEKLKEKVSFYEVKNYIFYDNNGSKNMIAGLNYYVLNDKNLDSVLFNTNVDLNNSKMFKWYDKDWNVEHRLAYNLKYH